MQIKTGIDIIEVERIKKAINTSNGRFLNRVFTEKEIEYCNSKKTCCYEHFAARFAAKEATLKAVSDLLENKYELTWKQIEILNNETGKPVLILHKQIENIVSLDVSLSHLKEYAIANVVVLLESN